MTDKAYITKLADRIIKKYNTRDPIELAEHLNIIIMPVDFKKQKGVYKIIKRNRFIFISTALDEVMQKIVLFHEIGHDLLHRQIAAQIGVFQEFNLFSYHANRMEYEANLFAAEISLPTSEFLEYTELDYSAEQIAKAMYTDINLVNFKIDMLSSQGYNFNKQDYNSKFLKG